MGSALVRGDEQRRHAPPQPGPGVRAFLQAAADQGHRAVADGRQLWRTVGMIARGSRPVEFSCFHIKRQHAFAIAPTRMHDDVGVDHQRRRRKSPGQGPKAPHPTIVRSN